MGLEKPREVWEVGRSGEKYRKTRFLGKSFYELDSLASNLIPAVKRIGPLHVAHQLGSHARSLAEIINMWAGQSFTLPSWPIDLQPAFKQSVTKCGSLTHKT